LRDYLSFDAACSIDQRSCLPKHCQTKQLLKVKKVARPTEFCFHEVVAMKDTYFHEFDETRRMYQHFVWFLTMMTVMISFWAVVLTSQLFVDCNNMFQRCLFIDSNNVASVLKSLMMNLHSIELIEI
jgi:hypothetical protein